MRNKNGRYPENMLILITSQAMVATILDFMEDIHQISLNNQD